MSRRVNVDVSSEVSAPLPASDEIARWVEAALDAGRVHAARDVDVAVAVVDAEASRDLNQRYRQRARPTNVLSFPADRVVGLPDGGALFLGDIVLCAEVVAAEAAAAGRPENDHWAHLCIHGALHLGGYDHVGADEAERMEALETRILAAFDIPDPYAAIDA